MNASLTIAAPLIAMRIQIARACGIDTALVLQRVGLNPVMLLNPMTRLTLAQDRAVWREIVAVTGDRAIGLKLGQYIKLPGIGIVGYLMMNASTVAEGMRRFCKYERLLTNAYRTEISQTRESLAYITHCEGSWQPERRQTLDFMMSAGQALAAEMAIDPLALRAVCFQYDRPPDIAPYAEIFGRAQLKFGCPDTRFVLTSDIAKTPVIGANPDALAMFDRQAERLLAQYERENFSDRVRQEIVACIRDETPTLSKMAARFNLSSRSLQLKLQEESTSYQKLLNEVRRDLAIDYLQDSNFSLIEIAYLLGFSQLSVFSRTFKRWTGQTPSGFQKQNLRSESEI